MADQFEYDVMALYEKYCDDPNSLQSLIDELNQMGLMGWEVVSVVQRHAEPVWYYFIVFKRRL